MSLFSLLSKKHENEIKFANIHNCHEVYGKINTRKKLQKTKIINFSECFETIFYDCLPKIDHSRSILLSNRNKFNFVFFVKVYNTSIIFIFISFCLLKLLINVIVKHSICLF